MKPVSKIAFEPTLEGKALRPCDTGLTDEQSRYISCRPHDMEKIKEIHINIMTNSKPAEVFSISKISTETSLLGTIFDGETTKHYENGKEA